MPRPGTGPRPGGWETLTYITYLSVFGITTHVRQLSCISLAKQFLRHWRSLILEDTVLPGQSDYENCWWRQNVLKWLHTCLRLHGVASQKTLLFTLIATKLQIWFCDQFVIFISWIHTSYFELLICTRVTLGYLQTVSCDTHRFVLYERN